MKLHVGVKSGDRSARRVNLGLINLRFAVKHLPLQVRQRHDIIVDHADRADTRRRQILDRRTANPASTDQQHMAGKQLRLPRAANVAQHDMAGVTVELSVC